MSQRIVVKIGSQVLCDAGGALNREVMANLARQIGALAEAGHQLLLVSSGAVAAGGAVAGRHLERIGDPVVRK